VNICNKNYRESQRKNAESQARMRCNNEQTKSKLQHLENQQDDAIKRVADYVGKLIGHVLFK